MPSSNDDKKSRYAAALFKNLFERKRKGRQFKKFAAAFEEFQDQLGALDGLTTAMQMLERLGVVIPSPIEGDSRGIPPGLIF